VMDGVRTWRRLPAAMPSGTSRLRAPDRLGEKALDREATKVKPQDQTFFWAAARRCRLPSGAWERSSAWDLRFL
jgi:hypothetical protein